MIKPGVEDLIYEVLLPLRRDDGESIEHYCRRAARAVTVRLEEDAQRVAAQFATNRNEGR